MHRVHIEKVVKAIIENNNQASSVLQIKYRHKTKSNGGKTILQADVFHHFEWFHERIK